MGEIKGGLTLPWLWVSVLIAFLALGFMLPPLDKPLRDIAKQSSQMRAIESKPIQEKPFSVTGIKPEKVLPVPRKETAKAGKREPINETKQDKTSAKEAKIQEKEALSLPSAEFKWTPARPGITQAQIALGRAVTLPFEFSITGNIPLVKLSIPKKFYEMGIVVGDDEVTVNSGKASSTVLFAVPPGKPLGKFELEITARDSATGQEIGKGRILFMLLPPGVGGC